MKEAEKASFFMKCWLFFSEFDIMHVETEGYGNGLDERNCRADAERRFSDGKRESDDDRLGSVRRALGKEHVFCLR
jgi:hypothetical protein